METIQESVAIYWGAFNPPTLAHAQVIKEVLSNTQITHIIISPSWEREDKVFWISAKERRRLIEIFLEKCENEWSNVSLDMYFFEGKNDGITTTRAEEEYFRRKLWFSPTFIFWSDVAEHMHWWSNNERKYIEEKLRKIFIKRPGVDFDFKKNGFKEYTLLDIPDMLDVSSSLAREMLRNKISVEWILSQEVCDEIKEMSLYT